VSVASHLDDRGLCRPQPARNDSPAIEHQPALPAVVRQRPCQRTQRGGIGGDHREQRPRSTVHTRAEPRSPFFSKASDGFGRAAGQQRGIDLGRCADEHHRLVGSQCRFQIRQAKRRRRSLEKLTDDDPGRLAKRDIATENDRARLQRADPAAQDGRSFTDLEAAPERASGSRRSCSGRKSRSISATARTRQTRPSARRVARRWRFQLASAGRAAAVPDAASGAGDSRRRVG
jgi:hypothetical protein